MGLIAPSKEILSALNSLKADSSWSAVLGWLHGSLVEETKTLWANKDEVQVRWSQGACQTLQEILKYAESSQELLHRRR